MSEQKGPTADELKKLVLLHDVAAGVMKLEKRGAEWWACCPFHGEDTPSFKISEHKGCEVFHCLSGETRVPTWNGTFPIRDLAGKTVRIMNRVGQWVDAPFFSFGMQPLWNIKLSRNGVSKNLRATAEHRWFVKAGVRRCTEREVTTEHLKVGQRLASVFPRCSIATVRPSPFGIAAGFVFGDGMAHEYGSVAQFCGDKDQALLPYFSQCHTAKYGDVTKAFDLPLFFKTKPSIDECATYLYGWLSGYFAADGCVCEEGSASLSSANIENLEFARLVATRLGIGTYGIRTTQRIGYGIAVTPLYSMTFLSSSLRENFFLVPEHRCRFLNVKKQYERKQWSVVSIEPSETEEVFCAVVNDGHAFVLEDNLLTGNCFGCGKSGSVVDFIELHEHLTTAEAFKRLNELADPNASWRAEAKRVQEAFPSLVEKTKIVKTLSWWKSKEDALFKNNDAMNYLTEVRGVTAETARLLHLGYVSSTNGHISEENESCRDKGWLCFPRVVGDKIVAVKMRSIVAKEFVQIAGMDAKALFNTETINALEPVFVTEGEFDAAIMEQAGFRAVSIPNATTKITPEWKVILKSAASVILAGDNDGKAGSDKMRLLLNELGENTHLILWPNGAKDANDFFREQCKRDIDVFTRKVNELVEQARTTPVEGFMSLIQRLRTTSGTDGANDPYRLHFAIPEIDAMAYIPVDAGYCIFYSTYTGSGKTVFTTQVILEEALRGEVVVVYSPELSGSSYLALVATQMLPERHLNRSMVVTQADYMATADALDKTCPNGNPFQFYLGHTMPGDDPLVFIESTLKIIRPTRFVIDTFSCIVTQKNNEPIHVAEKHAAEVLEQLGKKYGCLFIIVGQSNKEADELKEKRRDSHGTLRHSRVLQDKAHAIFLLHRKKKEDATDQNDLLETATILKMEKNRTAGPGAQQIYLEYVRDRSRFFKQTLTRTDQSAKMQPASSSDQNQTPEEMY